MTQIDKPTVAGSASHGNQEPPPTAEPRKASSEVITAAATAVVAEVITTAHGEAGCKGKETVGSTSKQATTPASATSKVKGKATTAPDNKAEASGEASNAQLGASPRAMKPGGDLRASFLAAVGNTISLTEPLGAPKINPDESSSSSGDESEPPVPLPRRSRRASSITRAGALSLSNNPNIAVNNPSPTATSARSGVSSKPAEGKVRRVAVNDVGDSVRWLLVAAPAYPGGVGGRLVTAFSSPDVGMSSSGGSDATSNKRKSYRMVFDGKAESSRGGTAPGLEELAKLPAGLDAVPDENDPTILCVREFSSGGDSEARGGVSSVGGSGRLVARVKAKQTASGSRESFYSVMLEPEKGGRAGAELMAVRISTHPTRLAAPREVQAVLLLPPRGEDAGGGNPAQENSGVSVWYSANPTDDGLWEAVAAGRVGEAAIELHSKPATWSSTTKSFELDLLEAWRPGQIETSGGKGAVAAASASSQPAPETVQMVALRDGSQSARSGRGGDDRGRIPSMQLARLNACEGAEGQQGAGGFSWAVAIAGPMPPLHGFCLAVVGLETGMVGAATTLVKRSMAAKEEEAAVGFVGFEKALTQDDKSVSSSRNKETPLTSARLQHQESGHENMPSVPALALGVVAPARAPTTAAASGRSSRSSSSRRPSSRRNGNNSNRIKSDRNEPTNNKNISKGGADEGADADRERRPGVPVGTENNNDGVAVNVSATGGDGRGGEGSEGRASTGRTVPVPVKRRVSVQVVAAKIVDKVYRNTYVCNLCLLTLTVSFVADLYPGSPSHNVPMSAALLWACSNVDAVRALRRRSFAYALSIVVLVSLFMDVDFLASDLKAYALGQLEEEDDDRQRVIVEENMHTFGRIVVGVVAGLKALSWQGLLATCPQGVHALNLLWRRFKLFLPIWGSPRKLTKEVYNRVVALAWLHLLASMALMVMAGVAGMGFEWAPQFASSQGAGIPLAAVCFFKSLTNLVVSAALFRNMDLALCLNVFGCLACFQGWHRAREERRRARHGVTYPKVVLEWDYIMLCAYVKFFDLLVGLWLWIGLGWSWSEDRDYSERHSIRMLLVAVTTVQTLTDVWSVFLGITVSLLVSQYLLRKEKSANAARNAFGDGETNKDVEIARSLSTGRLLASPPARSPASSADEGRGKGRGRREETDSSDADSYSTGESDSDSSDSGTDDGNRRQTSSFQRRGTASGVDIQLGAPTPLAVAVGATAAPTGGAVMNQPTQVAPWPSSTAAAPLPPNMAPRRRSMFAPGGNRLVYKRAFSARSSSDDSAVGGDDRGLPPPDAISLDRSFTSTPEEFGAAWNMLRTCASFRCRIGRLPEVGTLAAHLGNQGFVVVAAGLVADGRTKIDASARGVGVEALFFAELIFEKEMHELAFTFKCHDERLTSRFVCHMHLRRVIGDHQPIA
eukprot:g14956.t1